MPDSGLIQYLVSGGITTVEIAGGAWGVSAVFGLMLALLRDSPLRPLRYISASSAALLRSTPQLVLLYLVFFGLPSVGIAPSGLITATLVLGAADGSFNAEYYRASFLTVPPSQREAGMSLGFSRLGTLRHVVLPQALMYMIAPLMNSFLSLLKIATLASAIGVPEILYRGQNDIQLTGNIVPVVATVMAIYFVACYPLVRLVAVLEKHVKERLYT